MGSSWFERLLVFSVTYGPDIKTAVMFYVFCFCIIEMIVHEFGHYYFQKRFGIKVVFFKIGIFNLFTQTLQNGTKVVLGIPFLKAESRGLGELSDEMAEKDNPQAFYYRHRHPREHFLVAIGGALATLLVCSGILGFYFIGWQIFGISVPTPLLICFGMTIFNQFFNVLIPIKIFGQGTDAWVAYRALYEWYKKKPVN